LAQVFAIDLGLAFVIFNTRDLIQAKLGAWSCTCSARAERLRTPIDRRARSADPAGINELASPDCGVVTVLATSV
jgi:hypothetical protein